VDISWCGTQVCDGEKADLYACNDNYHNQQFTLNGASGQLVAEFDSHCLTACGAPKQTNKLSVLPTTSHSRSKCGVN
jgi:hypothetical protein